MNKDKLKNKKTKIQTTDMFSGIIGQEYEMLKLICPHSTEMSRLVGVAVKDYCKGNTNHTTVVELGGGTGITTLSILLANDDLSIISVDNESTMQDQAQSSLVNWVEEGRLSFIADDALTALKKMESNSADIVASAYTLHNFRHNYRTDVLHEILRVLKHQGQFINGDRYGLDDISRHTQTVQHEISGYFRVLTQLNKLDLLEHWIVHLFNDESENHVMRESLSLQQLKDTGFTDIKLSNRVEVNALVTAKKRNGSI